MMRVEPEHLLYTMRRLADEGEPDSAQFLWTLESEKWMPAMRAPKGRDNTAQANGLGRRFVSKQAQALKGRAISREQSRHHTHHHTWYVIIRTENKNAPKD